ncbi:sporulation protein, partial [Pseudoflavonifractor phocaeensis]|nr:sporulation protein [Pseudoflavonifractor phocaeensis]
AGVGAGWASLANFLLTLAALPLGRALGDRVAGRLLGRYALPLSGLLLVALGVWQVVGA